ncbi:MAG TPA: winged helix-turn-helix domain-containing protein [Methanomassiliicoccales archaeon]|nr:winged helix-turn-helix domain-containing protein [Methanomassiliicoccales archaeon]
MRGKRNDTVSTDGDGLPYYIAKAIKDVGGLEKLACSIPSPEDIAEQVGVYKAVSNHTRLTILWSVACCDMCPCVLKEFLNVNDSTLSYHLDVLERTGLIKGRPEKNWRIYCITDNGRRTLKGWSNRTAMSDP